jgi:hypothetical protein
MPKTIVYLSLLVFLLPLAGCKEKSPEIEWELTVDGDVDKEVTFTYQDLVKLPRAKLTDVLTQNPENPDEVTTWEGVTLALLLKRETGGVDYSVMWWVRITLADGTSRRIELTKLRGALFALKDGNGDWLAETGKVPIKLIAPNQPSSVWLDGPVRITVHGP